MKPVKIVLLSFLAVVAFDALAGIASQTVGFPYAYAAFGSALLYILFAWLITRSSGFWAAVLLGMAMGLIGLLPVSQTPSLGVMMKPEVVHGNEKNIRQRVQA